MCTEFESICREKLIQLKYEKALKKPKDLNIVDYNMLYTEDSFLKGRLKPEVGLKFWSGELKYIEPFEDWRLGKPLSWYQAYNNVKHNRKESFSDASFLNLTQALSGLFLLYLAVNGWGFFQPYATMRSQGGNSKGFSAHGCLFLIRDSK